MEQPRGALARDQLDKGWPYPGVAVAVCYSPAASQRFDGCSVALTGPFTLREQVAEVGG